MLTQRLAHTPAVKVTYGPEIYINKPFNKIIIPVLTVNAMVVLSEHATKQLTTKVHHQTIHSYILCRINEL